jgi:hypothetical protein
MRKSVFESMRSRSDVPPGSKLLTAMVTEGFYTSLPVQNSLDPSLR